MAGSSSSSSVEDGVAEEYPYPSNLNAAGFVSVKLSGRDDYNVWKTQMLCLFESHGMLGFIDGTFANPTLKLELFKSQEKKMVDVSSKLAIWRRSDALVKGWILGSLTSEVVKFVLDVPVAGDFTAKDVWDKLQRFQPPVLHKKGRSLSLYYYRIEHDDVIHYFFSLYRAAIEGDLSTMREIMESEDHDRLLTAPITPNRESVIHVVVGTGQHHQCLSFLLQDIAPDTLLQLKDINGDTPLMTAAVIGNLHAARELVKISPELHTVGNYSRELPIHRAAQYGQRNVLNYLLKLGPGSHGFDEDYTISEINMRKQTDDINMLKHVLKSGFYDIALNLIQKNPNLLSSWYWKTVQDSPLTIIAGKTSAFFSESRNDLKFWQHLVYHCIPVKLMDMPQKPIEEQPDLENRNKSKKDQEHIKKQAPCFKVIQEVYFKFWHILARLVPPIKEMQEMKLTHQQVLQTVGYICRELVLLKDKEVEELLFELLFMAAKQGIHELVQEIVRAYPLAILFIDQHSRHVLEHAIENRHVKVFHILYPMCHYRQLVTEHKDVPDKNLLHLVANTPPEGRLNPISGAALQMQRELQWFEAVKHHCVEPSFREMKNAAGKTPERVFMEKHSDLAKEGEKWMKDTAQSCMLVSSLMITAVFAAAITVPGGNNSNGLPVFSHTKPFRTFIISVSLSMVSSVASVLTFLSILTGRYAINDFHQSLPNKLIFGLLTLALSVSSLMIAFGATLCIVIGDKKASTINPLVMLACLPILILALQQFPLLWKVIKSTYFYRILPKMPR